MTKQKDKLTKDEIENALVYAITSLYVNEDEIKELKEEDEEEAVKAKHMNNVIRALAQLFDEHYK